MMGVRARGDGERESEGCSSIELRGEARGEDMRWIDENANRVQGAWFE